MKVTVSKPVKSEVTIRIESEESDLIKYLERAVKELGGQVKIPGFRPGKASKEVLEQRIGKDAIRAHALDLALPQFYAEAVLAEKVPVVSRPQIKLVTEEPFVFEAVVAILPEVTISGYDKIKVPAEEIEVTDKDVDNLIDYLVKQHAEYKEVERDAKMGDRVEVDFEGFDPEGDVPLEGTASKNHPVVLGEGGLIPGFEEQIVGMKAGEEKTFEITFPKDYHSKKFKDKKVKFKVKLDHVQEVKVPEVTKEWILTATGQDRTPEEFRQDVRDNLVKEREMQEKNRREGKLLDEILKLAQMDVPSALIEEEIDFVLDRTKMDIEAKGMDWDQYTKYLESQKRDLREENRERAEKQVKLRITLQHLYKEEKLEATDEEIGDRLVGMLLRYPKDQHSAIRTNYKPGTGGHAQIKNTILLEKFFEKFLS